MHLKLRHLAVFHAVMEEGSVSKAADRLGLTQPAVSIALTRLEELVGYSLFVRSKGYFVPRPEAEQLRADAELAVLAFEKFAQRAEVIGRGDAGVVRVGTIGSPALSFLPDAISEFSNVWSRVEVELTVRSSQQVSFLVGNGQMDVGIVEAPVAARSLASTIVSLPCVCIMREDDPLAAEAVITPQCLAQRRLISVHRGHHLDRQIRDVFSKAGLTWQTDLRCYFFAIMRKMVANGAGVAIVDVVNGCADLGDGVVWRPFGPAVSYDLAIITGADATLQSPAVAFLNLLVERLRSLEVPSADAS